MCNAQLGLSVLPAVSRSNSPVEQKKNYQQQQQPQKSSLKHQNSIKKRVSMEIINETKQKMLCK